MSSIITGVLKLTFGLLWDKLRDYTAERLQDGDVTDEKCRKIIVRELDNIKSVLEGLSRKDLLASISFLKEGVCLLNNVFNSATDADDVYRRELRENKERLTDGQSSHEMPNISVPNQSSPEMPNVSEGGPRSKKNQERFEEAIKQLPQKISNLDTASKDILSSARKSFADARREATRAFNNKALSTKDRILACKLRVISRLLENFETPAVGVETCMLYLEELHQLEAIREIFGVHINGGLKSRFNKRKRLELMSSVIIISYVLANFTLQFAEMKYNLLNWPKVELASRSFHPLLDPVANDIMHGAKIGAPHIFPFDRIPHPQEIKLQNQTIIPEIETTGSGNLAEIIIKDGEMHLCFFQNLDEITSDSPKMLLVATNDGDNTYVVAYVKASDNEFDFLLFVGDQSGKVARESNLEFLSRAEKKYRKRAPSDETDEFFSNRPTHVEFIVNTTANFCIIGHLTCIYVCDGIGVLSHCFETTDRNDLVYSTSTHDVITARYLSNTVYIYSMSGNMLRQFNAVKGQVIYDVVSHHSLDLIYALTRNHKGEFQLETYTHLGEHRENLDLIQFNYSALFAMHEGPVAIIYDNGFILI